MSDGIILGKILRELISINHNIKMLVRAVKDQNKRGPAQLPFVYGSGGSAGGASGCACGGHGAASGFGSGELE